MANNHEHPYQAFPERSFWSKGFQERSPVKIVEEKNFIIDKTDKVVSAGSCFASHIIAYLEREGINYIRTEQKRSPFLGIPPENLGYDQFSAAYGHIYTPRQLYQLYMRALLKLKPKEEFWHDGTYYIDPFRPGMRYKARSIEEFRALTHKHLQCTLEAFKQATVFIFTPGLTECWVSNEEGTVFPSCPGTIAGRFDPLKYSFKNFTVSEVIDDLNRVISLMRCDNPHLKIILTVSPVPLVATASGKHVLCASIYSKSVLRAAIEEVIQNWKDVYYFPSYEIITGPQAPDNFFEANHRSVTKIGVDTVMTEFIKSYLKKEISSGLSCSPDGIAQNNLCADLSKAIMDDDCEEVRLDPYKILPKK